MILPLPSISHDDLLGRALREEKPFRVKGDGGKKGPDGYRDMLVWASAAERAAAELDSGDMLIMVTANHVDFCDAGDTGTVAAVLRADLGDSAPAVRRLDALARLADILPPRPEEATELQVQRHLAPGGRLRQALLRAISESCDALAGANISDPRLPEDYRSGLDLEELKLPLRYAQIASLDPLPSTADAVVYGTVPLPPGEVLATLTVEAIASLKGFIFTSDASAAENYFTTALNEHTLTAEQDFSVALHFNVAIRWNATDGEEAVQLELEKITSAVNGVVRRRPAREDFWPTGPA